MTHTETLQQFLLNRLWRMALATVGLVFFSFGLYLQLVADVGLAPWQVLNEGLFLHLPITFGQTSILISLAVVAADLLLREPIGVGTILDALVVGWATDFFLWLDPVKKPDGFLMAVVLLLLGTVAACVSQYIYMKAALSCGPRDALLVAVGKRLPKIPIGTVNILMTAVVLAAGWILGGTVGVGTLITLFGTGIIMDLVFKVLRFEPRTIVHEGLTQTIAALKAALTR